MKFIEKNDFNGRKVAVFGTSGGNAGMEVDLMAAALKHRGATVLGSYHCKGKAFLLFSTGHPNLERPRRRREKVCQRDGNALLIIPNIMLQK